MNAGWVYGAQMPNALNRAFVPDRSLVTPYQYLGHEQVLSIVSLKKTTKRHWWGRMKCELFNRDSMFTETFKNYLFKCHNQALLTSTKNCNFQYVC